MAGDCCDRLLGNRKMNKMQSFSSRSLGSHREVKTGKSLIPSKETIREVLIKSIQVGQGRAEVNSRWGQSGRLHGENGN